MGMEPHSFGGKWTEEKLAILADYLRAYRVIFKANKAARYLTPIYVDAFAGTGYRAIPKSDEILQDVISDEEAKEYREGSVRIALGLENPFVKYVFIEKNPQHAEALKRLRKEYYSLADRIEIIPGNANEVLIDWASNLRSVDRAVVFLDPYGMQVEWPAIEALGQTEKVDMWLLFPLGIGVNRLLTKNRKPNPSEARRLTLTFGTEDWEKRFYGIDQQPNLFSAEPQYVKTAHYEDIAAFFIERLRTVFHAASDDYRILRNSRGAPMYMLCFAAANKRGAKTALKIAGDLLRAKDE